MPADECAFCCSPGWRAELRLTAANELICHDCHDDGQACDGETCDWLQLLTTDELLAMREMAADDRAHAAMERRAGL